MPEERYHNENDHQHSVPQLSEGRPDCLNKKKVIVKVLIVVRVVEVAVVIKIPAGAKQQV